MTNWIEGTIKLRGKSEDLRRFFTEELEPSFWLSPSVEKERPMSDFVRCEFADSWSEVRINNGPHIKETRRAFIQDTSVYWDETDKIIAMPIKQAWSFCSNESDMEVWTNISKRLNLDIRLYGFEQGGQFCEEIEIIKGNVIFNKTIKYADWYWECPMPLMGG